VFGCLSFDRKTILMSLIRSSFGKTKYIIKIKEEKRFSYIAINIDISMFIRLFKKLKITVLKSCF